jgi:uracil phosphoribosyltransferase
VSEIHVLSVIASKRGLSELLKRHPDVHVTLGVIDDMLSDEGDVLPGLGDAGDRLFGTGEIGEEDELVHVSKRKRTMSDL